VQLDAEGAGDFLSFEIDLGDGGEGLGDGVEDGGDVVMLGEEGGSARSLGVEGRASRKKRRD
jgi:hypothetical protein